jgi:hypothetical protein
MGSRLRLSVDYGGALIGRRSYLLYTSFVISSVLGDRVMTLSGAVTAKERARVRR